MGLFCILLDRYHTASSSLVAVASPAVFHTVWSYLESASNTTAGSAPRRKHDHISQSLILKLTSCSSSIITLLVNQSYYY